MRVIALFFLFATLALVAAAVAEQKRSIDEDHRGYLSYRKYCASCHGVFADGKGPVAGLLTPRPADLSRMNAKYGTPLPKEKLAAFIDGRTEVGSHGPREMPVWGAVFAVEHVGEPFAIYGPLLDARALADYLRTLQVE